MNSPTPHNQQEGRNLFPALRWTARRLFQAVWRLALVSLILLSVLGYLGKLHWVFELTRHFRLQYLVGTTVVLVVTLLLRQWKGAVAAAGCLLLNAFYLFPWVSLEGNAVVKMAGTRIKLVQSNVLFRNNNYDGLIAYLKEEAPDIVVLQEVTPTWAQQLEPLQVIFPFFRVEPQGRGTGIALYSRLPLAKAETLDLCANCRLSIMAQVNSETTPVMVITIHPTTPTSASGLANRNQQFDATAAYLNNLSTPKILVGDFNDTMWSSYHERLLQQTNLVNVRAGMGILPSWHASLRLAPFMIPIDHCLISSEIKVVAVKTGKDIGSDHLPLVIELIVPPQK